jgi:hypothetical protein
MTPEQSNKSVALDVVASLKAMRNDNETLAESIIRRATNGDAGSYLSHLLAITNAILLHITWLNEQHHCTVDGDQLLDFVHSQVLASTDI